MEYRIIDFGNGGVIVSFKDQKTSFMCIKNNDVIKHIGIVMQEIYEMHSYDKYDTKDKYVVDIGAYYGDTAIYFLRKGAKMVYCYEPYVSAGFILPNIAMNYYGDGDAEVFQKPVLGEPRVVKYKPDDINYGASRFKERTDGIKVVATNLLEIVIHIKQVYNKNDMILKMDCEDSEHEIIANTPKEILRMFQHLMIEAHYKTEDIVAELEYRGFKIDEIKEEFKDTWIIYATRVD